MTCVVGDVRGGGHVWQERWPLQQMVCILLECILVSQACVSHSVHVGSLYDVTSCLAAWSRVPFGGRGVSVQRVSFRETPPDRDSHCTVKSGRYASYWNAFLLTFILNLKVLSLF